MISAGRLNIPNSIRNNNSKESFSAANLIRNSDKYITVKQSMGLINIRRAVVANEMQILCLQNIRLFAT